MGEKDGESHMVGATVSPDGTIGTKDFYNKQGKTARPPDIARIISRTAPSWRIIP